MLERRDLRPIAVAEAEAAGGRTQVAALCWRIGGEGPELLLVTSRETGRWVLPKGWPVNGLDAAASAAQEAWEEAGVRGRTSENCVGLYAYTKVLGRDRGVPCVVAVYPLAVESITDRFPERGQRKRRWFTPVKAARRVAEPELAGLLSAFDPGALAG